MFSLGHVSKVVSLLEPKEKRRLYLVFTGAIFMALLDVVGVGSIMPFMAVASKPELMHTNAYLARVYAFLGFSSDTAFLVFLGVSVVVFLVLSNAAQALTQYTKVRFTSMRRHTLSLRLLKGYLGQSYTYFLNRNSYEFVKNLNTEISLVISGTLIQFVELVSRTLQVGLLTGFLFFVNPMSTLGITVVVVILYGGIFFFVKKRIRRLGSERFELATESTRVLSEAFWGIKEVKMLGLESVFANEFVPPSKRLARNESVSELIGDIPKFALETVAFSMIMVFVLITIVKSGNFQDAAGAVSLFAYAGYRMIPAVQSLFKAITKLKYGAPTAERIIAEFAALTEVQTVSRKDVPRLPFSQEIDLQSLVFSYPNTDAPTIREVSLRIPANALIGLAGKTGSGKTTLVDIILGLLWPQGGQLVVDGTPVTSSNVRSWQANIGYVPQNIFLSNDSIAANIAFGVPRGKIDMGAVERAAQMAQIHGFVQSELKEGYSTKIGERGIRLSGGQRQRVGIARALYRNPSVLVMDEATSALDGHTEEAVMEAIDALSGTKTIILIAHRLTTLRKCSQIYLLERGEVVDRGGYEELVARNPYFHKH